MSRTRLAGLTLSAAALVGIAVYEGYRDDAYVPVPGDVPTIGFGETQGVKLGDRTTPTRALVRLLSSADQHAQGVKRCLGENTQLHQHEFDAYVSLAYNIGVGAFCRSSIPAKVQAQRYEDGCKTILLYNRAGGKVLNGLVKRREAEFKQCMGDA